MSHIESLIVEYLNWQGFLVKNNIKVGKLKHGGWEMELDVIGFHPFAEYLVHYEPSLDADKWEDREARYSKKFKAGAKYIHSEVFPFLPKKTPICHIAVFPSHPKDRHEIAGGKILSIDELIKEIKEKVDEWGIASRRAIPENFPLLRTIQFSQRGYHKVLE